MKIICEGVDLSDAVMKVVKACSTKTTNPILECIKLSAVNDTLILLATDSEISIEKKIKAEVLEEGELCVPGKYFADFIKKLENVQIVMASEEDKLNIRYGNSESCIQVLKAQDFPAIDLNVRESHFSLKAKDLKDLVAKTTFCCAQDDSRPVLKGCLIETKEGCVSFTALDGYRMAIAKKNILSVSGDIHIICPARTLNEISRFVTDDEAELDIYVQKNRLLVCVEDTTVCSRLYEGEFINVSNIIPKSFTCEVIVNKESLKESVDRAAVLARTDKNSILTFDIKEDNMAVTSNTSMGRVDESVHVLLEGKDVTISLNSKYIGECLNAVSEDSVRISFNGAFAPCILTPSEGDSFLYLILPVRTTA